MTVDIGAVAARLEPATWLERLLAELGDRAIRCEVYDPRGAPIYHDLSLRDTNEIRELVRLVRPIPGPVLDLAAGSGRLTFPLLALGRAVTALELSESMLELLRVRLAEAPARLRQQCAVVPGDMRRFDLDQQFGAIVLGTTSVSLLDEPGRAELFGTVAAHLRANGRFLLSTLDLPAGKVPAEAEFEFAGGSGRRYRMRELLDAGAGLRTVAIHPLPDGDQQTPVCTSTVRVLPPDLLARELAAHGLRVRDQYAVPTGNPRYRNTLIEAEVDEP